MIGRNPALKCLQSEKSTLCVNVCVTSDLSAMVVVKRCQPPVKAVWQARLLSYISCELVLASVSCVFEFRLILTVRHSPETAVTFLVFRAPAPVNFTVTWRKHGQRRSVNGSTSGPNPKRLFLRSGLSTSTSCHAESNRTAQISFSITSFTSPSVFALSCFGCHV